MLDSWASADVDLVLTPEKHPASYVFGLAVLAAVLNKNSTSNPLFAAKESFNTAVNVCREG